MSVDQHATVLGEPGADEPARGEGRDQARNPWSFSESTTIVTPTSSNRSFTSYHSVDPLKQRMMIRHSAGGCQKERMSAHGLIRMAAARVPISKTLMAGDN